MSLILPSRPPSASLVNVGLLLFFVSQFLLAAVAALFVKREGFLAGISRGLTALVSALPGSMQPSGIRAPNLGPQCARAVCARLLLRGQQHQGHQWHQRRRRKQHLGRAGCTGRTWQHPSAIEHFLLFLCFSGSGLGSFCCFVFRAERYLAAYSWQLRSWVCQN